MLSPSLEDYLEEVYRLSLNRKEIRIKDVADCLKVSMPSVVKGLRRLHKLGYIVYIPYEKIELSEKGIKKGRFLVSRNKILSEFIEVIDSNCDIKQEAEAMEHYLSISTIKSIEKLVKFFNERDEVLEEFKKFRIQSVLENDEI